MLVLTRKEIEKIIPLKEISKVIGVVKKAFSDYADGKVEMPPKLYLDFKEYQGDLRIMPSYSRSLKMAGTKIVNVHPLNNLKGLPTVMAVIVLNDPKTGMPLAVLDGTYITALRTGASGALATDLLARKDAKTLGVVGAGMQAITQIMATVRVRKIKRILVYDLLKEKVKKLSQVLKKEGIQIEEAKNIKEVSQVDILTTITPSRKPIVKKEWIKPGTHINAIGADAKGKEELDPEILKNAKIVIDCFKQASHSGEINVPLAKGIIKKENIHGEIGEIVSGKKPGRENEDEITIFDSTGLAIQDLYTATLVYKEAKRKKIGKEIKII
jgi:alanine dehydrogenase